MMHSYVNTVYAISSSISQNYVTALSLASVHGKQEVCTLLETKIPAKETLAPQVSYLH